MRKTASRHRGNNVVSERRIISPQRCLSPSRSEDHPEQDKDIVIIAGEWTWLRPLSVKAHHPPNRWQKTRLPSRSALRNARQLPDVLRRQAPPPWKARPPCRRRSAYFAREPVPSPIRCDIQRPLRSLQHCAPACAAKRRGRTHVGHGDEQPPPRVRHELKDDLLAADVQDVPVLLVRLAADGHLAVDGQLDCAARYTFERAGKAEIGRGRHTAQGPEAPLSCLAAPRAARRERRRGRRETSPFRAGVGGAAKRKTHSAGRRRSAARAGTGCRSRARAGAAGGKTSQRLCRGKKNR